MRKVIIALMIVSILTTYSGCDNANLPSRNTAISTEVDDLQKYVSLDESDTDLIYFGPMLIDEETALLLSDEIIVGLDNSWEKEVLDESDYNLEYDETAKKYTISRIANTEKSYTVELLQNERGSIKITNIYIDDAEIQSPYIMDADHAEKVAVIVMTSLSKAIYDEDLQQTYPEVSTFYENDGWCVHCGQEGFVFGNSMWISVEGDKIYDLSWSGG